MRQSTLRPYSSFSGVSSERHSFSGSSLSRKPSSAFTNPNSVNTNSTTLIDQGKLDGKIKIHTIMKNSDYCTSVNYRPDGRFYAVSLANGIVNVYSSKTNNILYTLNNEDHDITYAGVSATCVRFQPFQVQQDVDSSLVKLKGKGGRRKSSGTGSTESEVEPFLPPITNRLSLSRQSQQYVQRRRKSSVSALGLRSSEVIGIFMDRSVDSSSPSNLVTASFTNGSIKTFNFLTEQCVREIQEKREILTLAYNNSGSQLATGGGNGQIFLYDGDTNSLKGCYNPPVKYDQTLLRTYSISFHPQSEHEFVAGGWNKKIQFFDSRVPNFIIGSVDGPKVTGEGISFHPSGDEFCVAARDRKRCIEIFNFGERKPLGNLENGVNTKKPTVTSQRNATDTGSLFFYSARYLNSDTIAFGGSHSGALTILNRNPKKRSMHMTMASVTGLRNSVNCIDTFRNKIMFIVQNEVACAEVFE